MIFIILLHYKLAYTVIFVVYSTIFTLAYTFCVSLALDRLTVRKVVDPVAACRAKLNKLEIIKINDETG